MVKSPEQLTPLTLTKRVMSGNTTKEYLEAFQKLNPNEIPYSSLASHGFSRFDIIQLWNSLQKTPNKVRYYTFSLVHDNKIVQENINKYYEHEKYAYILHDKDTSSEHKHYHYVLMFSSPRSFKSVANDLQIPVTMLQKVYSKKGILDYLTHENDPNKHHYDPSEITSNFDIDDEKNDDGPDVLQEFKWYCDLREGRMSAQEFIERLHLCIVRHQVCQRVQLYERAYNASSTGASLSSRSEFSVPNPCNSPPQKIAFSGIDPNSIDVIENGAKYSYLSKNKTRTKTIKKLPPNLQNNYRKDKHGY